MGVSAPLTPVHRPHALRLLLQLPLTESPVLDLSGFALNAWVSCKLHMPVLRAFDGTFVVLLQVRGLQADTSTLRCLSSLDLGLWRLSSSSQDLTLELLR